MKPWLRWVLGGVMVLVLAGAALAVVLHRWVASDDFRLRVEREASAALGVPVRLGAIEVGLWPLPAVAVNELQVQSKPALTLQRVEARPAFAALVRGRLQVATFVVRHAVIPQAAVAAISAGLDRRPRQAAGGGGSAGDALDLLPRRAVLDHVTWIDAQGRPMTVDAEARLADDGALESLQAKIVEGQFAGARATLTREADHWPLQIEIGGGQVTGRLQLQPGKAVGARLLTGSFDTQGVEVAAFTAPSRTLTGRLQARTQLRAEFRDPAGIAEVLQTQTQFTVRDAVIHGIDLAQAVKTVGLSRGGETRLETLAGEVVSEGRVVQLNNLVATSGGLSANGQVTMAANKALSGQVTVDVANSKGTLGVPLVVGGTIDAPSVTLSRAAVVGAAIGTMITPGVGTAAGAKLGEKLRGLLGGN